MEEVMRKSDTLCLVATLAAGMLTSSAQAEEPRASIEAGNKQWEIAVGKGDGAAVAGALSARIRSARRASRSLRRIRKVIAVS
jgi:hypothetical protein